MAGIAAALPPADQIEPPTFNVPLDSIWTLAPIEAVVPPPASLVEPIESVCRPPEILKVAQAQAAKRNRRARSPVHTDVPGRRRGASARQERASSIAGGDASGNTSSAAIASTLLPPSRTLASGASPIGWTYASPQPAAPQAIPSVSAHGPTATAPGKKYVLRMIVPGPSHKSTASETTPACA